MRNFYCQDCETLIGQVGEYDIAVKCPKCHSLNSSADAGNSDKRTRKSAEKTGQKRGQSSGKQ